MNLSGLINLSSLKCWQFLKENRCT